ncbi:MAG TPA: DUF5941 domain-containing protein [Solirubrobacteraceae bacterium]|nr:DUF5941 domain-containing protein [Solirubrobacteraceae bacterium]
MSSPARSEDVYRDDGPLALALARALRGVALPDPALLAVAGGLPLVVVLAWPVHVLSAGAAAAAVAWLVLAAAPGAGRPAGRRFAWTVPPLLRALEYGTLIKLTALADPGGMAACYALLAVLAFHHYDAVYRLRQQGVAPAAWRRIAGGGWDGRLLVAAVLTLTGGLAAAEAAAAVVLGVAFAAESIASWARHAGAEHPAAVYEDDELEDA